MIHNVEKTTPSEDVLLAWLAGIVDGEGTIGIYKTHAVDRPVTVFNLAIVNSDLKILDRVEFVLKRNNIFYSKYLHNNKHPKGFLPKTQCFVLTVRRRDDFEKILYLIRPFLVGKKLENLEKALEYLKKNPRKMKPMYICQFCGKKFFGRKKKFCTLICWHKFSIGKNNPNFRHGKYIACND